MNNIYRIIWNEITGCWTAVSENVKSKGKASCPGNGGSGAVTAFSKLPFSKTMLALACALVVGPAAAALDTPDMSEGMRVYTERVASPDLVLNGKKINAGDTDEVADAVVDEDTTIAGTQNVLSGGTAKDSIVENKGKQSVAGITEGVTVNAGAEQIVADGGVANGTKIEDRDGDVLGAKQFILSGGIANNATVAYIQEVGEGGKANASVIDATGIQYVSGTVTDTVVNVGGQQLVNKGGVAEDTRVSGEQGVFKGTANNSVIEAGGKQSVAGGLAKGTTIFGVQEVSAHGIAEGSVVKAGGVQNLGENTFGTTGTATDSVIEAGGIQNVQNGGVAKNTQIAGWLDSEDVDLRGIQSVHAGGIAEDSKVSGLQEVDFEGIARNSIVEIEGVQKVAGKAENTEVKVGGTQLIEDGGITVGSKIAGVQVIDEQGTAENSAIQSGGEQHVIGRVVNTSVEVGGLQIIGDGGVAQDTTVFGKQDILVGGTAKGNVIEDGGEQFVAGSVEDTVVKVGGTQTIEATGNATRSTISGKQIVKNGATVVDNILVAGADQDLQGDAKGTKISAGSTQTVRAGASADGTQVLGTHDVLEGATASNSLIGNGGKEIIAKGGTSTTSTIKSGGLQELRGNASATIIETGGIQAVHNEAVADGATVTGQQHVYQGGLATNSVIENGGEQLVTGQVETLVTTAVKYKNALVMMAVTDTNTVADVIEGGVARNSQIKFGGTQTVKDGGVVEAARVAGLQNVAPLGTAKSSVILLGGEQQVAGTAEDATVQLGGKQTVLAGGIAKNSQVYGSQIIMPDSDVQDTTIFAGGQLGLAGAGHHAITGLTLDGGTLSLKAPSDGQFQQLQIKNNLSGVGAIALNSVLAGDDSASDVVVMDGGHAKGDITLQIHNAGGAGAQTSTGIKVVDTQNNGTTEVGVFKLGERVRAGAYDYRLFRGGKDVAANEQDNWYLRSTFEKPVDPVNPVDPIKPVDPVNPVDPIKPVDPVNPVDPVKPVDPKDDSQKPIVPESLRIYGPELSVYGSALPTAVRLGQATMTSMQDRSEAGATQAIWTRVLTLSMNDNYSSNIVAPSVKTNIAGLQAGMDIYRQQAEKGIGSKAGVFVTIASANADVDGMVTNADATAYVRQRTGKIKLDSQSVGGYWGHVYNTGWYTDASLQYTMYRGNAATNDASIRLKGRGITAALAGGYAIQLKDNLTLEPQAQVVWQNIEFNDAKDRFSSIKLGSNSSALTRIGARLLYSGQVVQPYVRANYFSMLSGKNTTVAYGTDQVQNTLGGNWLQLGAGVTVNINEKINLSASLDRVVGIGYGAGHRSTDAALKVNMAW